MNDNKTYSREKDIRRIENISNWMDTRFKIPGTDIRFGLDPVIGLVPFLGELTTFAISGALVLTMAKHGVSRKVIILMLLNVFLDVIIGSIPVIGNIFDFTYRANYKNVRLLKRHYQEGKYQGSGAGIIFLIVFILIAAFVLIAFGLYKLFVFIFDQLGF